MDEVLSKSYGERYFLEVILFLDHTKVGAGWWSANKRVGNFLAITVFWEHRVKSDIISGFLKVSHNT